MTIFEIFPGDRLIARDENLSLKEYMIYRYAVILFNKEDADFEIKNLQFPILN